MDSTITSGWDFAQDYLDIQNDNHRLASDRAREGVLRALNRLGDDDESAQKWIRERKAPIFFIGVDDSAYTCHLPKDLPKGAAIVILAAGVTKRPVEQIAAVVAHEIGHIWLRDHHSPARGQEEELAADAKASGWGFAGDLAASLAADVADEADPSKKARLQLRVATLDGVISRAMIEGAP